MKFGLVAEGFTPQPPGSQAGISPGLRFWLGGGGAVVDGRVTTEVGTGAGATQVGGGGSDGE